MKKDFLPIKALEIYRDKEVYISVDESEVRRRGNIVSRFNISSWDDYFQVKLIIEKCRRDPHNQDNVIAIAFYILDMEQAGRYARLFKKEDGHFLLDLKYLARLTPEKPPRRVIV